MEKMHITGGVPLRGNVKISGAKNATLPLMTASLLTGEALVLENAPMVSDVLTMKILLQGLGTNVTMFGDRIVMSTPSIESFEADYDIVRKMRASILVLGPLIARNGCARVSMPGGCAIGLRPVNYHIDALRALGIEIHIDNGYICADGTIKNGEYRFPEISVTGTENIILATALSNSEVILHNTAIEPEVSDLIKCLNAMGAQIEGDGTQTLCIKGAPSLSGTQHKVVIDRIELGTYIMAAAMTKGRLFIENADLSLLPSVIEFLREAGVKIEESDGGAIVSMDTRPEPSQIDTSPFPGFPTDLQAQSMALMSIANGISVISENIWENRFMHVCELARMGADINVRGSQATVKGVPSLCGASVMATDLRASSCLIIAALAANGESTINRIYHLDRGYENLEEKLLGCGAAITRLPLAS